jgi:hypothetical protein
MRICVSCEDMSGKPVNNATRYRCQLRVNTAPGIFRHLYPVNQDVKLDSTEGGETETGTLEVRGRLPHAELSGMQ